MHLQCTICLFSARCRRNNKMCMFSKQSAECIMTLQGYPMSLSLAPVESA